MIRDFLRRTRFKRQLTVILTVAILGLAVFSSLMNSWEASRRMRGYLVEQGLKISENLARQSTLALLFHSADNARDGAANTLAFPDVLQVEIIDTAGKTLLALARPGAQVPHGGQAAAAAPLPQPRLERETDEAWFFGAPVYGGEVKEASPFELQEHRPQLIGRVRVILGKGTMNRLALSLLLGNLAITLSFALILLGLMRLLAKHVTRPLNALSHLMRRAEAGESGMRAAPDGPRDLVEMASAFNKMMAVLEEREAELKHSRDDALRTAMLKAQFAATVSHEVRTPLNGVVGMLELLKEMRLTKRQRECVDVAWNSSQALIELINDILDFSKMEAGKLELEEIDFNLRKLIEEIIELLAKNAQQKGLELCYLMDPALPDRIRGDSLRLRQVLLNLIGNAVKFTERGEVSVHITPWAAPGGGFGLRFEIKDTGIGMSQHTIRHVFESFTQGDRAITRRFGGTGLGLAICRQLVDLMGGEIGVASESGQGSTFWFTVCCKQAEPHGAEPEDHGLRGVRALVVDDSEVVRAFLRQTLSQAGAQCAVFEKGCDALAELQLGEQEQKPYDLVIMDMGATDEQDYDLARRIRAETALSRPRLLILDRFGMPPERHGQGGDAVLGKPLRRDRVLEALRNLLAGVDEGYGAVEPARPSPAPERKQFRVLVAEDNRTNQMVAAGMLAMNGCECEFACNGREAVEAARSDRFDLILMDCSMPEMDGYEATAHIRNHDEPLGRRTPIVAMTANTQRGDADKCLAAGMDDYLAKPITLFELRQKLDRWLAQGKPAALPAPASAAASDGPLDLELFDKLRDVLGVALHQAVTPFLEDTPAYLKRLEQAVKQGGAEAARAMAHSIKGSSGNLGALHLSHVAKEVEELALQGRLDEIAPLLPRLRRCYEEAAAALEGQIRGGPPAGLESEVENSLVLVVEDDRSTRSALRYTLQREGFRVEEAEDGAQALQLLKRLQPDVILMDAMMPVMDGFTACARVQELPSARAIPVLMITALEDNTSVERAFAAGASDYIPKPIHFAVLSQRVRRVIDASKVEKRIRHMAYNDSLTGLPNRVLFIDQLGRAIEQARQAGEMVAVLFLDLDRFKYVNDTLGHEIGDRLLSAVAQRLRRCVRAVDCVARMGGDEFTVILGNVDAASAATAAQNICRALTAPFEVDGHDLFVTTSVGISLYPNDGADVGTLIKHADTAMYRAKKNKSGFQFFEAAMENSLAGHVRLEADLRRALERGELEVYYQPQARLADARVVGAEALVRWHHPVRGMIAPAEFIPVAEDTGLIIALGECVLRSACAQVQGWIRQGFPELRVAVNVSVRQLLQKDFAATVERALADSGLPARLLELEITESTLMEQAEDALQALHRLRSLGLRLSIDDFGTGYSSLAYLKRFPVDVIKIDRSFVRDICEDADDAAIVAGIIALAHSLRLDVVAEGVETEAQLRFLRDKSCDMLQGYYLSQAVPAQQFAYLFMSKDVQA